MVEPMAPASRLILHGASDARSAAASVWGVGFSEQACQAVSIGDRATLWLGPDEYLLWDASRATELPMPAMAQALQDIPHALVDVSHRQVAYTITGPHAATVLSGACPLDLDLAEFPLHMCTRTVFAKADIILWRTEAESFHVEVWRSFAPYFTGLIAEIARDLLKPAFEVDAQT